MRKHIINGLLLALYVTCIVAGNCDVSIKSRKLSSWSTTTETYSVWEVELASTSSARITSLELYLPSPSIVTRVWEILSKKPDYYTLPNDSALFYGGLHTFGYIVQSSIMINISISDVTCDLQGKIDPWTPFDKVCDVVLVVDSFIVRTTPELDAIRTKYTSYFADVDLFYQRHFNTKMNLIHMHLEEGPTFSTTYDEGELLDSFRSALAGDFFGPDMPKSACTYHLVTGRDTPGIGGLSWIDTLCSSEYYNTGFSVDLKSQDEPVEFIRRMIHELGHGFGGQHFDYYSNNTLYKCEIGNTRASDRILRSTRDFGYKYISDSLFLSPCAANTMRNSIPSFSCLWNNASAADLPSVALYEHRDFMGPSMVVYARNGITPTVCYNIVYPYGGAIASFELNGISGIRFFEFQDCIGQDFVFRNTTSSYVRGAARHKANSFQFIE